MQFERNFSQKQLDKIKYELIFREPNTTKNVKELYLLKVSCKEQKVQ